MVRVYWKGQNYQITQFANQKEKERKRRVKYMIIEFKETSSKWRWYKSSPRLLPWALASTLTSSSWPTLETQPVLQTCFVWPKSPYVWPNMPLFFETKSRPYNCKPEKGLLITLPVPPLLSLLVTRCICLCTPFPPKPQQ